MLSFQFDGSYAAGLKQHSATKVKEPVCFKLLFETTYLRNILRFFRRVLIWSDVSLFLFSKKYP